MKTRVALTKVTGSTVGSSDILDDLSVALAYSEIQAWEPAAIAFSLEIQNGGGEAVTLLNPYDLLTYMLTDDEGWPVSLQSPASRLVANAPGFSVWEVRADYLPVVDARVANTSLDREALDAETVTVPANGTVTYRLRIAYRVARGGESPNDALPISKGRYQLSVLLPLITRGDDGSASCVLQSEAVNVVVE